MGQHTNARGFRIEASIGKKILEPRELEVVDEATLPDGFGETRFERIALDGGGAAVINRVTPTEDLNIMVEPAEENRIISSMLLKGSATITLGDGEKTKPTANTCYSFRYRNEPVKFSLRSGIEVLTFGISLPTALYRQYLGDDIPDAVRGWMDEESNAHHLKTFRAPSELRAIFMGSEAADFIGPLKRAYFEGAALMYASLVANEIAKQDGASVSSHITPLSRTEIDAVEAALDILKDNLIDPPTLTKLARAVGLSEKRINQAFRVRFGSTVFGSLRKERLEHARRLLEDTDLVAKEVAWASGYGHVSNFSNAFRQQFGYSPADYKNRLKT